MNHLSLKLLAETVISRRKTMGLSQAALSKKANINRSILSRLETCDYSPSVDQLLSLSAVLGFKPSDVIVDDEAEVPEVDRKKIAVAGTGYVGLSLAVLLSQHNDVTAVDIIAEKVDKINAWKSPIQDEYIEKYMAEHEERGLCLSATTDAEAAYSTADFIIIAAPTNYDPKTNFFDCSAVEAVLGLIKEATADKEVKPTIVIKSTIPVGYTVHVREKMGMENIIFSPEFLRESKALYDNLYPSRIIVGADEANMKAAEEFAALLQQGAIKTSIYENVLIYSLSAIVIDDIVKLCIIELYVPNPIPNILIRIGNNRNVDSPLISRNSDDLVMGLPEKTFVNLLITLFILSRLPLLYKINPKPIISTTNKITLRAFLFPSLIIHAIHANAT